MLRDSNAEGCKITTLITFIQYDCSKIPLQRKSPTRLSGDRYRLDVSGIRAFIRSYMWEFSTIRGPNVGRK